ncbi:MAG: GIY-YIG nuclease family protein [Patescibacteria group bacterium]
MFYIYFLRSLKNRKVYVGFTSKLPEVRLAEHHIGTNTWTRQNGPFELLYFEMYYCKEDAMAREKFYKSGFGRVVRDAILVSIPAKHQTIRRVRA